MQKAIIVGASAGIGRELTKILLRQGYCVTAMARRIDPLRELRTEAVGGELHIQPIDIANTQTAQTIFAEAVRSLGGADLVIISAGTGELNAALDWRLESETIQTNVTGFAAIASAAMRHFIKQGSGHLVGISSVAALRGGRGAPAYNASKAFVSNYLEGLRQKAVKMRLPVTVTDIRPGFVQTAMAKGEGVFWAAPVEKAGTQIYTAIMKKKKSAYVTKRWRLIAWLLMLLPGCIYEKF